MREYKIGQSIQKIRDKFKPIIGEIATANVVDGELIVEEYFSFLHGSLLEAYDCMLLKNAKGVGNSSRD